MRPTPPSLLKLLALPLSRPKPGSEPVFLLHALRSSLQSDKAKDRQPKHLAYVQKATDKAADLWAGLGKADSSWKNKIYGYGEGMMDKIEYEEWALKAIDPALAPKPWEAVKAKVAAAGKSGEQKELEQKAEIESDPVELLFPSSLLKEEALVSTLKETLQHRDPHHRSAAVRCIVLSPLTWPFAILPVIPNLPLFYVLWRAWSHYRAHKASSYLLSLLTSHPSHLSFKPSSSLDSIYSYSDKDSSSVGAGGDVLLTLGKVDQIAKEFGMNDEERKELERAVGQVKKRVEAKEEKVVEEKAEVQMEEAKAKEAAEEQKK